MPSITFDIQGRDELVRQLRRLGGPKLRQVARMTTTAAMKPVLTAARGQTPVDSGQLRASLGQLSDTGRRGLTVSSRVGTRRDFTYRSTSGSKMAQGRGKRIDKAVGKGATLTKSSAQQYAAGIHFGTDKSGRVRRKAGGAQFLEGPLLSQSATIINNVADDLRRHVETQ